MPSVYQTEQPLPTKHVVPKSRSISRRRGHGAQSLWRSRDLLTHRGHLARSFVAPRLTRHHDNDFRTRPTNLAARDMTIVQRERLTWSNDGLTYGELEIK